MFGTICVSQKKKMKLLKVYLKTEHNYCNRPISSLFMIIQNCFMKSKTLGSIQRCTIQRRYLELKVKFIQKCTNGNIFKTHILKI